MNQVTIVAAHVAVIGFIGAWFRKEPLLGQIKDWIKNQLQPHKNAPTAKP